MATMPPQSSSLPEDGSGGPGEPVSRDAAFWAKPVDALHVDALPDGAINLNVEGRGLSGPFQGFGQLWQKSYRMELAGADVTPEDVVARWKERFASYWPDGFHFYGSLTGIAPGEVAVLNLPMPAKVTLSTGVLVLYADERSFTFMNAEGHMFGGFITFSADREPTGADGAAAAATVAKVDLLIRANTPISEVALSVFGQRMEDRFWTETLRNLAADHGVDATPTATTVRVDPRRQWRQWRNVTKDAVFSSALYSYRSIAAGLRDRGRGRRTR